MSDTQNRPRLTVEDAGSTADPADLVNSGVGHAVTRDEDPIGSADEVVRTTGEAPEDGSIAEPVSTQPIDEPAESTGGPAGADAAPARGDLSALADADLGHVFDQTNGVIERADGDSDGTAESDVLSAAERADEDPLFDDAGVRGDGEVPEVRRTGD